MPLWGDLDNENVQKFGRGTCPLFRWSVLTFIIWVLILMVKTTYHPKCKGRYSNTFGATKNYSVSFVKKYQLDVQFVYFLQKKIFVSYCVQMSAVFLFLQQLKNRGKKYTNAFLSAWRMLKAPPLIPWTYLRPSL